MATEEVEYQVEGKTAKFRIRQVKYGEWQKVMRASGTGNVEMIGNTTKGRIDTTQLTDELMKLAVEKMGDVDFHDLTAVDGMDLQDRVLELNGMGKRQPFRAE